MKKQFTANLSLLSIAWLSVALLLSCSKNAIEIPDKPEPPKVEQPKKYDFTIKNISEDTLFTYNNNTQKPKENYPEVAIAPAKQVTISIESETGTTPMIRSKKPNAQTEYSYDERTKTYSINIIKPTLHQYGIVNISVDTLITYNNDPQKPKENYPEIILAPGKRVAIQIESPTGTTPMIKGKNRSLQTEYEYEATTKFYGIYGYEDVIEVLFTGDVKLATIFFPNPTTGQPDSLVNVELPQVLKYSKLPDGDIVIQGSKQKVAGSLKIEVRVKGIQVETRAITAPYGVITSTINAKSRKSTSKTYDPEEWPCGTYNGRRLITGPKGGCYYINSNGNKTYVDREYCHCD